MQRILALSSVLGDDVCHYTRQHIRHEYRLTSGLVSSQSPTQLLYRCLDEYWGPDGLLRAIGSMVEIAEN